jgi:hypothetical protein
LCNEKNKMLCGPWYFPELIAVVFEYMRQHAKEVASKLAMTKVAKVVFDAPDYAFEAPDWVRVEGNSQFGKTEAVETWCRMRPGLARLVKVPSLGTETELFRAIGEALGMDAPGAASGVAVHRLYTFLAAKRILL